MGIAMHAKSDSDETSIDANTSSPRPLYFVQSTSHYDTLSYGNLSPFDSLPHHLYNTDHYHSSPVHHSRESSTSRFSTSLFVKSSSCFASAWRKFYVLCFLVSLVALFTVFSLILWAVATTYPPKIYVQIDHSEPLSYFLEALLLSMAFQLARLIIGSHELIFPSGSTATLFSSYSLSPHRSISPLLIGPEVVSSVKQVTLLILSLCSFTVGNAELAPPPAEGFTYKGVYKESTHSNLFWIGVGICIGILTVGLICLMYYLNNYNQATLGEDVVNPEPEMIRQQIQQQRRAFVESFPVTSYTPKKKGVVDTCSVCLDDFVPGSNANLLPWCGHTYHTECLHRSWTTVVTQPPLCPYCRRDYTTWTPVGTPPV